MSGEYEKWACPLCGGSESYDDPCPSWGEATDESDRAAR